MADLRIRDSDGRYEGLGPAQTGETLTTIADNLILPWVLPRQAWWIGGKWRSRALTPLQEAARAIHEGLIRFRGFVALHADGAPIGAEEKVKQYLYQAHRGCHLVMRNAAGFGDPAVDLPDLTSAERILWATTMRFGPLDTSVITELGVYDEEGLFDIFAKADEARLEDIDKPLVWVDPRTANWTDANTPLRTNVGTVVRLEGTVANYLNIYSLDWIDALPES